MLATFRLTFLAGSFLKADANQYGEWTQAKTHVFHNEEESCLMFEYIAKDVILGVTLEYFYKERGVSPSRHS